MAVKWRWNTKGFAQLRNHPTLVGAMESAATAATAGTPFEVEVWPHQGRKTGPRTSVQIWASSPEAVAELRERPEALHDVLARTGIPFTSKRLYVSRAGSVRVATDAQIAHWTRGGR